MLSYAIRRILLTIPTLIAVAVLVFFVLRVVPGDIVCRNGPLSVGATECD